MAPKPATTTQALGKRSAAAMQQHNLRGSKNIAAEAPQISTGAVECAKPSRTENATSQHPLESDAPRSNTAANATSAEPQYDGLQALLNPTSPQHISTATDGDRHQQSDRSQDEDVNAGRGTTEPTDSTGSTPGAGQSNAGDKSTSVSVGMAPSPGNERRVAIRALRVAMTGSWAVVGQVVSRKAIREYSSVRGNGRMFSFHIIDSAGDTMAVTVFNQGVDAFDSIIRNGGFYLFSGGRVKTPNRTFSSAAHELTLDHRATIRELPPNEEPVAETFAAGISFLDMARLPAGSITSVIGVILQVDGSKLVTSQNGKSWLKRDFTIVDDSMSKVVCTVWGSTARDDISRYEGAPILIERATVKDYEGVRSLNVGIGSAVHFEPTMATVTRLVSWYEEGHDPSEFTFLAPMTAK